MKKRRYRKVSLRNFSRAEYITPSGTKYSVINPTVSIPRRSYRYLFYSFIMLLVLLFGSITLNMCS